MQRYGQAKIRDIWRPGKTQAGTRDSEAEIRDVPENTGRLASLIEYEVPMGTRFYRVGQKTGPLCYIVSNFGNSAQIYTIFLQN